MTRIAKLTFAAAQVVCESDYSKSLLGGFMSCVDAVYEDALQQAPTVSLPR